MSDEMDAVIPPSSAPRIPQSVFKPRAESSKTSLHSTVHATPTRRSSSAAECSNSILGVHMAEFGASVQATPTRKSSLAPERSNSLLAVPKEIYGAFPPSSPLQQRHSGTTQSYGVVPDSAARSTSSSRIDREIQETPVKRRSEAITHVHPPPFAISNKENTKATADTSTKQEAAHVKDDIYKTLGWDDDDDDELA